MQLVNGLFISLSGLQIKQSLAQQFPSKTTHTDYSKSQVRRYYRRNRTKFVPAQIREMEAAFDKTQYPDVLMREELGKRLNISESRIQVKKVLLKAGK